MESLEPEMMYICTVGKKIVKSHQVNALLAVFSYLVPLCGGSGRRRHALEMGKVRRIFNITSDFPTVKTAKIGP